MMNDPDWLPELEPEQDGVEPYYGHPPADVAGMWQRPERGVRGRARPDDVVMTTQEHGDIVLPDLRVAVEVTDTEVWIQTALDDDVSLTLAFPNDGQDHREGLGFLTAALPQIIDQSLNALEGA